VLLRYRMHRQGLREKSVLILSLYVNNVC